MLGIALLASMVMVGVVLVVFMMVGVLLLAMMLVKIVSIDIIFDFSLSLVE